MTQKRPLRILFPRAGWVAASPQIASANSPTPTNEQQKLERDMWRVVWVLLPIAAVIFLLLVIQRLGLLR